MGHQARRHEFHGFSRRPPKCPGDGIVHSDGEQQCCLTHPKTDLFFLRPFNATTADWEGLDSTVHVFDGFQRFRVGHVAIDYDPGWLPVWGISWYSDGPAAFAVRAATDHLEWAENLWFVDYRIRRSLGVVQPMMESRRQFHGNGCKFTEVRDGDAGWELGSARDIFDLFLSDLWDQVDEYFRGRETTPDYPPHVPHDGAPNVGVLAYEEC